MAGLVPAIHAVGFENDRKADAITSSDAAAQPCDVRYARALK
jgi:hypothetical protein